MNERNAIRQSLQKTRGGPRGPRSGGCQRDDGRTHTREREREREREAKLQRLREVSVSVHERGTDCTMLFLSKDYE